MGNLAANRLVDFAADDDIRELPLSADAEVFAGAFVSKVAADSYWHALVAGEVFGGIAYERKDATGADDGDIKVRVRQNTPFLHEVPDARITDIMAEVYASDDHTLTITAGANTLVGKIVAWESGTMFWISPITAIGSTATLQAAATACTLGTAQTITGVKTTAAAHVHTGAETHSGAEVHTGAEIFKITASTPTVYLREGPADGGGKARYAFDKTIKLSTNPASTVSLGIDLPANAVELTLTANITVVCSGAGGCTKFGIGLSGCDPASASRFGVGAGVAKNSKLSKHVALDQTTSTVGLCVFAVSATGQALGTLGKANSRLRVYGEYVTVQALPSV